MPASFADHGAGLCQATDKALDFIILWVIAIAIVLVTFATPALATDLKVDGYISPAVVLVTMEPLAPVSRGASKELLATGPPSRILLIGKDKTALPNRLPSKVVIGKVVTNATGDEIGIITKVDGSEVVVAVGGYPGASTYHIGLKWDDFTTNDHGKNIKLLKNVNAAALRSLPAYRSLD